MTYSELVEAVQAANTNDPVAATMIPVQSGRFLGLIYRFAESYGLPRISSLIINKNKGDCGAGLSQGHDCAAERLACYRFDWRVTFPDFGDFIKTSKANIVELKAVKKITVNEASQIRWSYFNTNRARLVLGIQDFSVLILNALMNGIAVEVAFAPYLKTVEVSKQHVLESDDKKIKAT